MEDKKPEEAESKVEMEQNVELATDAEQKVGEVIQTEDSLQVSDETSNEKQPEGQEEFHALSVGSEQNKEYLGYTKYENDNEGASDESAELPGEESNSNDDLNILNVVVTERNKQQTREEVEQVLEEVQHQLGPSSQLDNQARRACDESAELPEDLSKSYHDQNIQNEIVNEENEQQTADEEIKTAENMLQEPCVLDPMLSRKLDNEASELHAAGEATLDGTSIQMGQDSLSSSPVPNASWETMNKLDLGTEREMDKKLVEENEKMREMVEKLMEAGKEQIAIISKLSGRVKDLERWLTRKKKLRRGCGLSTPKHPTLRGRIKA